MNNTLLAVIVLVVGLDYCAGDYRLVDCSDLMNDHLLECFVDDGRSRPTGPNWKRGSGNLCVWNNCKCYPGKPGCKLECSNDPRKVCNGMKKGEICDRKNKDITCQKSSHLVCVPPPNQGPK